MRGAALLAGIVAVAAGTAWGQVSPVGAHHTTAGPGAGLAAPVSPTGGYAAAVPLDLPSPRGSLPVPLSIVYTGSLRAGAAGAGWDVPFWYVRRSDSTWRRKPAATTDGSASAVERIYVAAGGAPQLMIPNGDVYVPFMGGHYGELRRAGGSWVLKTLENLEYTFSPVSTIDAGEGMRDDDLWLLTQIRDTVGTDRVVLTYETYGPSDAERELHLVRLAYGFDASGQVPLYEVSLDYTPAAAPFDSVQEDALGFVRRRLLSAVMIRARDNLAPSLPAKVIRAYQLVYGVEQETGKPRLTSVETTGEEGTGTAPLPVARYGYGGLSAPGATPEAPRVVSFGEPVPVTRPAWLGGFESDIATSAVESQDHVSPDFPWIKARVETTRVRHLMRDFTGDGVPDLLFRDGDRWVLYHSRLATDGVGFSSTPTTWVGAEGPAEIHVQSTFRFAESTARTDELFRQAMVTTETWSQFVDWNGDGRLDVIDVGGGQDGNHWRVWLNEPAWNAALRWRPIQIDVGPMKAALAARGLRRDNYAQFLPQLEWGDWLSLERTRSWPRLESRSCQRYTCTFDNHCTETDDLACEPGAVIPPRSWATDSLTEWQLEDVNRDGFPDLVAADAPVHHCQAEETSGNAPACYASGEPWQPNPDGYYACLTRHREWIWGRTGCDDTGSRVSNVVFLNRSGPFTGIAGSPFAASPVLSPSAGDRGVAHWTSGSDVNFAMVNTPSDFEGDEAFSWRSGALVDRWGTGFLRWADEPRFNAAQDVAFETDRHLKCGEGHQPGTPIVARATHAEVDVNGDGLADHVSVASQGGWVRFNTGYGYSPPRKIESPSLGFAISESRGTCDRDAQTVAGLTDMDGDGKPELIRVIGGQLYMSRLVAAEAESLGAVGRLIAIGNDYGASTWIRYGNAKQDFDTPHKVPFPEIVVREVRTFVHDGSAESLAPTYFAYGTAELEYDPLAGTWGFPGYRRTVALAGLPYKETHVDGVMTISVASPGAAPGATYEQHAVAHRPVQQYQSEGLFALANLRLPDTVGGPAFSEVTTVHRARRLGLTGAVSAALIECGDLDPATGLPVGTARCAAAGLVYSSETQAWEGLAAPPSLKNTLARSRVMEVDGFGRPIELFNEGDVRRTEDDVCTLIKYASPHDGGAFPSVPRTVALTDCGWGDAHDGKPGTPKPISAVHFAYDDLPLGDVIVGRLTRRLVDRYDGTSFLDTHEVDTKEYDALGEVRSVATSRSLGSPVTRRTTFERDAFGATITKVTDHASDVDVDLVRTSQSSTWPSRGATSIDPNGIVAQSERDGFGRVVREIVVGATGQKATLRRIKYNDSRSGREIITETFPANTAPGGEDGPVERSRAVVVLDALGRARFTQTELGADYAKSSMVTGLVEYDALGRVAFAAAPFESFAIPFVPAELQEPLYGVTSIYDRRGRVVRSVEAHGRNETASVTSVADNVYVSTLQYGYLDGRALTSRQGPSENSPGSVDALHRDESWRTATGQEVERARWTWNGNRIDLVRNAWDRLGHLVETTRYAKPAQGSGAVVWQSHYDSLGNRLTMTEPGMATRHEQYDEHGNNIESWYLDGGAERVIRSRYDGFGRLTTRSLLRRQAAQETVESTDRFHYDHHSGAPQQPAGDLRGRLSWSETPGVAAIYRSYDAFGRQDSTSYRYFANDQLVRERAEYTAPGRLTALHLDTPTTNDTIVYTHDSAGRVRTVQDAAGMAYWRAVATDFDGYVASVRLGNGVIETFERADTGRRQQLAWRAQLTQGAYTYVNEAFDAAGRVTEESLDTPAGIDRRGYTFDALGRVANAVQVGGGWPGIESFEHDALGNLTARTATTGSEDRVYEPDPADPDRLCRFATPGTSGPCDFAYDGMGNVVTDSTYGPDYQRTLSYDASGRISKITRAKYFAKFAYGPEGRIQTQIQGFGKRVYWHFGSLIEERTRSDGGVQVERRIPGPQGVIATLRSDGTRDAIVYVHADGRAPRAFSDEQGRLVQATTYSTFGRVTENDVVDEMTSSDDLWNGGDDIPELGVVLLGPRAYDPDIGRFLQRDPIAITARASTANPYAFAFSDPVNSRDGTGLSPQGASPNGPVVPYKWEAPGNMPGRFYVGLEAHRNIAYYYKAAHPNETVFTNTSSVLTILGKMSIDPYWADPSVVSDRQLAGKPDIYNLTTNEIYEIKPATMVEQAGFQVDSYVRTMTVYGVPVRPGDPSAPGTHGVVPGPEGVFVFWSPAPGRIVYSYRKAPAGQPYAVPVPHPVWASRLTSQRMAEAVPIPEAYWHSDGRWMPVMREPSRRGFWGGVVLTGAILGAVLWKSKGCLAGPEGCAVGLLAPI